MTTKLPYAILAFILTVSVNFVLAQPGNALNLDGTNDNVSINTTLGNFGTGDFTIEAWIRTTSGSVGTILAKRNANTYGNYFRMVTTGTGQLSFEIDNVDASDYTPITGNTSLNDGRWHHVAIVRSTTQLLLYADGQSDATPVTIVGTPNISNAVTLTIGQFLNIATPSQLYTGSIDELRIWNTARTATQIQNNAFNTVSNSSTGLLAYYNFDAASGTTLTDQTSNSNTGTLNNFALSGSTSNWVESYAMVVPTSASASAISNTFFTANWTAPAVGTVTNYFLDVSTSSSFGSFVSGYNGLSVAGTSQTVTGLSGSTTYYYRVKADKTSVTGQGGNSYKITAATTASPVAPGNALNLDGTNDYVSVSGFPLTYSNSFTAEAWIKPSSFAADQGFFTYGFDNASTGDGINVFINTSGNLLLNRVGFSTFPTGYTFPSTNRWYHVALTRASGTSNVYVDGVLVYTSSITINTPTAFVLGAHSGARYFNGSIDEFRFYSTALTNAQIVADMFSTTVSVPGNLVAYYNFDAGTAGGTNTGITTLSDQSSSPLNGVLNNFALSGSTSNWVGSTAWNTWTGGSSSNWSTAANWQLGSVPTSNDNAVIPNGASNLPVSVTGSQAANNLSVQSSGASVSVTGTLLLSSNNYNAGSITVNPSAAMSGSYSALNAGTVTLQQSIVGQRGFRVFANPFTTTQTLATVASNNAITIGVSVPTSGVTDSRTWSNSTGLWSNVTGSTWAANTAYALFIRGLASEVTGLSYTGGPSAFTYKASGTLNGASVAVTPSTTSNFIVVGNPYAAPVKSQSLTGQVSSANYYTYQISVTGTPQVKAGSWVASGSTSDATHTIPVLGVVAYQPASTSTFNVTTSDINTTGTLQSGLFGIENTTPQIELLVEQNGNYWDKLFVRLDANSTASGKERTDLLKFYNENVNVYTIGNDETRMAIDARNVLNNIPLGISALAGDYNFKLNSNNLPEGTIVYLNDKFLNTKTALKVGATYNFSITADTATHGEQRFELSFSTKTIATANDPSGSLTANVLGNITSGNQIEVQIAGSSGPLTICIKDMNGKALGTMNAVNGIQYINVGNTAKGMFLLQISDGKSSIIKKVMKL